jgi:hypothetical protein
LGLLTWGQYTLKKRARGLGRRSTCSGLIVCNASGYSVMTRKSAATPALKAAAAVQDFVLIYIFCSIQCPVHTSLKKRKEHDVEFVKQSGTGQYVNLKYHVPLIWLALPIQIDEV